MPSYLYRCDHCGGEIEFNHPINTPKGVLPLCCSDEMNRVFTAPAVILKGTGWGKDKK